MSLERLLELLKENSLKTYTIRIDKIDRATKMYWRDCDAWRHENLSMNTTSNEAAKLYDCCLTQLVKWREDQLYGGIDGTLAQMLNADPSFVMGHVLKCGTELIGNALPSPKSPSTSVETLLSQADIQSPNLSKREMMSVEGALFFTCFFFGMFFNASNKVLSY